MAPHSAMLLHSDRGGAVDGEDGAVLSMLHGHGADGVDMDIAYRPRAELEGYLVWYASGSNACS